MRTSLKECTVCPAGGHRGSRFLNGTFGAAEGSRRPALIWPDINAVFATEIRRAYLDLFEAPERFGVLQALLAHEGIHVVGPRDLSAEDRGELEERFMSHIFPIFTPLAVDPAHPFPFISNLSLNIAVVIRDPHKHHRRFARVKVPKKNLPRFVSLPTELHGGRSPQPRHMAVPLEHIGRAHV